MLFKLLAVLLIFRISNGVGSEFVCIAARFTDIFNFQIDFIFYLHFSSCSYFHLPINNIQIEILFIALKQLHWYGNSWELKFFVLAIKENVWKIIDIWRASPFVYAFVLWFKSIPSFSFFFLNAKQSCKAIVLYL